MIQHEEDPSSDSFNTEYLKTLSASQLADTLIGEAHTAAAQLLAHERSCLESQLMGICWTPNEEERKGHEEWSEGSERALDKISQAILAATTGEELDPEDASQRLSQFAAGRALAKIERLKREIESGIETGEDIESVPWTEGSTKFRLVQLMDAQAEAGINVASDYVRETALSELDRLSLRGAVLLRNAADGDKESYKLGVETMQEALQSKNISFDDAHEILEVVLELMQRANHIESTELKNLAIDMIDLMRPSGILGDEVYSRQYATLVARAAVFFRLQKV
jgi:hypothetical protein